MLNLQTILIVEDEVLIGLSLADAVGQLGGDAIGPFATVEEANAALDCVTVDGAILDAKLLDGDITPLALRLANSAIPIVLHSGTGIPPEVAERWPQIPCVSKPAAPATVVEVLCAQIANASSQ